MTESSRNVEICQKEMTYFLYWLTNDLALSDICGLQKEGLRFIRNLSYWLPQRDFNHVVGNLSTGLP